MPCSSSASVVARVGSCQPSFWSVSYSFHSATKLTRSSTKATPNQTLWYWPGYSCYLHSWPLHRTLLWTDGPCQCFPSKIPPFGSFNLIEFKSTTLTWNVLERENLSWQGTCNYTGLAIGFILGNPLFILTESTKFSNKYFRPIFGLAKQPYGLVTMQQFMVLFAITFFISTMVLLFINEDKIKSKDYDSESDVDKLSLTSTYKILWKMLSKSNLRKLMLILFTFKVSLLKYS